MFSCFLFILFQGSGKISKILLMKLIFWISSRIFDDYSSEKKKHSKWFHNLGSYLIKIIYLAG